MMFGPAVTGLATSLLNEKLCLCLFRDVLLRNHIVTEKRHLSRHVNSCEV